MPEKRRGIPGVTRPLGESDDVENYIPPEEKDHPPEEKDHGLNQLIKLPQEIVVTGFKAILGASLLLIVRKLGINDLIGRTEKEIEELEQKIVKNKGDRVELQKKVDEKREFLNSANEGLKLSEQIVQMRDKYQNLSSEDYLFSLLAETIGNEGLMEIENNFLVSQGTNQEVKPVTTDEISLSQTIMAKSNDKEGKDVLLKQYIQQLEKINLVNLGKQLLNLIKIEEIKKMNNGTDVNINLIPWDEALLAAVLGATGRTSASIRGGYKVRVEEGNLVVYVGGDRDQIAPLEKILLDFDIPEIYEAALAASNQELPLFKSRFFSALIKKAMGVDIMPGRIDIGQTGSSDKVSYPALNVKQQVEHLEIARTAALEMGRILKEINSILDFDNDDEDKKAQLIRAGIKGALEIPRYQIVMDLMNQINPTRVDGLSNRLRFPERENLPNHNDETNPSDETIDTEKELSEEEKQKQEDLKKAGFRGKISPEMAKDIVGDIEFYQAKLANKFSKKEGRRLTDLILTEALDILGTDLETIQLNNDLAKAGFAEGINERTASMILEHPETYLTYYAEQFGKKEGKRLMKIVEKASESLLPTLNDFETVGEIEDLHLAGYPETMTQEQAKDFLLKIQRYQVRLLKIYGEAQGNRITNSVKLIAKKVLKQFN